MSIAGLEATYHVRAAMDPTVNIDELVREILDEGLPTEVAAAAITGWVQHHDEDPEGYLPAFRLWGEQRIEVL